MTNNDDMSSLEPIKPIEPIDSESDGEIIERLKRLASLPTKSIRFFGTFDSLPPKRFQMPRIPNVEDSSISEYIKSEYRPDYPTPTYVSKFPALAFKMTKEDLYEIMDNWLRENRGPARWVMSSQTRTHITVRFLCSCYWNGFPRELHDETCLAHDKDKITTLFGLSIRMDETYLTVMLEPDDSIPNRNFGSESAPGPDSLGV